jgi:hypothetical protein
MPTKKAEWIKKKPKDQQWIKKKPKDQQWIKKKGPEVPEIELHHPNERGGRGLGAAASPAKKDKEGIIIVVEDKEMRIQKKGGGIAQKGLGRAFKKGGKV